MTGSAAGDGPQHRRRRPEGKPAVLCVDDEPNVLNGVKRHLRRDYQVTVASSAAAGLRAMDEKSFSAVVSDLRMPEMDGIEFLGQVRHRSPSTTRILLSGNADLRAAVSAVNEGSVFRFLTKPCPPDLLISTVQQAVEQHRLVNAERELLERTLHGSVEMLTEVLALAAPEVFGAVNRLKRRAGHLAAVVGDPARWKMEMAAMLSRVAYITVPAEILDRARQPYLLTESEQAMIDGLPRVAEQLLADLPRLEDVREILRHQQDAGAGPDVPIGSSILAVVLALESLEASGFSLAEAVTVLRGQPERYHPVVLATLGTEIESGGQVSEVRRVPLTALVQGMILLDPLVTTTGRLLVAEGHEVSYGLVERLRNVASNVSIVEPLRVLVPEQVDREQREPVS